jgi:hypothetical protein
MLVWLGIPNTTVNSFLWNTTSLPDGEHTVVVNVTDTGGFSASQTVYLFTDNQLIALEAEISRLQQEISGVNQSLSSLNATTSRLQQEISGVNQSLSSLNATVQSLQAILNTLKNELSIHVLDVSTVSAGGVPLQGISVTVENSTGFSTTRTTDSAGQLAISGLAMGTYTVSAKMNGTLYSTPVKLITNATVVLEPPILQTVAAGTTSSGKSIYFPVTGNVTGSQMTGLLLQTFSNNTARAIFNITGLTDTAGFANITIPKSDLPSGVKPMVYIDGTLAAYQGYTQDATNYYLWFATHFSTHQVVIEFTRSAYNYTAVYAIIVVLLAVLIASAVFIMLRKRHEAEAQSKAS